MDIESYEFHCGKYHYDFTSITLVQRPSNTAACITLIESYSSQGLQVCVLKFQESLHFICI